MLTADFDYTLPEELIASEPLPDRAASRMMVIHRATGVIEHRHFSDLPSYAQPGDLFVLNDSRVIYDAGAKYGGSPYTGRLYAPSTAPGPKRPTDKLFHCILSFPATEPLLGTDESNP